MGFTPQIGADQLYRYDPIDEHVPSPVHDAHPAFADARLQPIAACDDFAERGIVCPFA
jgi:hypothetical protein